MIDEIFNKISHHLYDKEEGNQQYNKYKILEEHEGWKIHQNMLITLMNEISTYMLSGKYTKLDKEEKDVQQRAFFMVKQTVEFLLNPLKGAERYVALQREAKKRQTKSSGYKKTKEPKV